MTETLKQEISIVEGVDSERKENILKLPQPEAGAKNHILMLEFPLDCILNSPPYH